jgi:hypothetical protein
LSWLLAARSALERSTQATSPLASAQFFLVLLFTTRPLHVHLFAALRGSGFVSTTHLRRSFFGPGFDFCQRRFLRVPSSSAFVQRARPAMMVAACARPIFDF